jgi:secondary thiamine-phosphate synthase enzyme
MWIQRTIRLPPARRGFHLITQEIVDALPELAEIEIGWMQAFIQHTSASLIITENADRNVRHDLENYIARLVRDGDPAYLHDQEGPDDMAAHIRSVLTQTEITIPIQSGRLALGTWQGLFLWEHRLQAHRRRIMLTLCGEHG